MVKPVKQAKAPLSYPGPRTQWDANRMSRGQSFEVIKAFEDADGDLHQVGEAWTLVGTGFNKFEDEMWVGVRTADGTEWQMPLVWNEGCQADVLERWETYVRAAP